MIESNLFWPIVKEIYPYFLMFCGIMSVKRMGQGIISRFKTREEGEIGKAIEDIIVGLFWAHVTLPLIAVVYYVMKGIGYSSEKAVEVIIQNMEF